MATNRQLESEEKANTKQCDKFYSTLWLWEEVYYPIYHLVGSFDLNLKHIIMT